jgi:hypothetical protein
MRGVREEIFERVKTSNSYVRILIFSSFSFIAFLSEFFFFLFTHFAFFLVFYFLFFYFGFGSFYRPSFPPFFLTFVLSLFFGSCGLISSLP